MLRRPRAIAGAGLAVVEVLAVLGTQLNASEARLERFPGTGTAIAGRQLLADAHINPGVLKPFDVLVERGGDPDRITTSAERGAGRRRCGPGGLAPRSPLDRRAFPMMDGSAPGIQAVVDRVNARLAGTGGALSGITAVDRDLVHALFGSFRYVFALS